MNPLSDIIKSEIRKKGRLTFSEFMDRALYHQEYGYYTSGKARIGKGGDYYTSPGVNAAFGGVLARFITKSQSLINGSGFCVVEFGGGSGLLASDILDSLERDHPEFYEAIDYRIIEKSVLGPEAAENTLCRHNAKVRFMPSISEIETECADGVILSNELVDALPFHRVRFADGAVKEIFVTLSDGEFAEIPDEPSTSEIAEYFNGYEIYFREGQEAEVNLNAGRWLGEAERVLRKGFILTVDYGYLAGELYSPERTKGTYKCIYKHSINENPYLHIGEQDITAHVDFSNLIRVGESLGLEKVKYTTQGQFLVDWGILDLMTGDTDTEDAGGLLGGGRNLAIKNLFLPGSMGNRFKVLLQKKSMNIIDASLYPESPLKLSFGVV